MLDFRRSGNLCIPRIQKHLFLPAQNDGIRVSSICEIKRIAPLLTARLTTEATGIAMLDARNNILAASMISVGDAYSCIAPPEGFVRAALSVVGCTAVVTGHNHIIGGPEPSDADLEAFGCIGEALRATRLHFHDNLIISGDEVYSFREHGHFAPSSSER